MSNRVYIETSIISYLTARPLRLDQIAAVRQKLTLEWWNDHRRRYELHTSEVVLREAARGDPAAAARRLAKLEGIRILDLDERITALAELFLRRRLIPESVPDDALHVAVAIVHRLDYLLTWNYKDIAHEPTKKRLETACRELGYVLPGLCTPEQLMGD